MLLSLLVAVTVLVLSFSYSRLRFIRFRQYAHFPQHPTSPVLGHLKVLGDFVKHAQHYDQAKKGELVDLFETLLDAYRGDRFNLPWWFNFRKARRRTALSNRIASLLKDIVRRKHAELHWEERILLISDAIPAGAWRPFEHGLQNCIGLELASIEARIIIALAVRRCDFIKVGIGEVILDESGQPSLDDTTGQYKVTEVYPIRQVTAKPVDAMMMSVKLA
ncbi:hypothetical protein F4813DRAFT_385701 [Daldinia decipiens]|uniref:uncharacterized protein n=1 Tax=Daldinia decipiens TaxID=326647 RepID=UPI0020C3B453|nr:uncharacterized protein F4813DRAFT_385701 [Daldinia decipiens]KAI1661167.1 hypothetical protein F4813DRAFT_385701 [Daldinia decipiens]